MSSETTKHKVERLESKVDGVCTEVKEIKDNHLYHLSMDVSNLKGQLIYIKWFILAVLGVVIMTGVKLWFV